MTASTSPRAADFSGGIRQESGRGRQGLLRLARLCEEMPDVIVAKDPMTTETLISGQGELELEIVRQKLQSKFGADAVFKDPKIAYRESIRKTIQVQGRHKKQSGGHGQFGDVWIEFSPPTGHGFRVRRCGGRRRGAAQLHPVGRKGSAREPRQGRARGLPMTGLRAKLPTAAITRSIPPKWRSRRRRASRISMHQRQPGAWSRSCMWKSACRTSTWGDIMGDLNKRRGRILGMEQSDGKQLIIAGAAD